MSSREWFKDWFNSTYYHKLYFERDESEAHRFIDLLVEHLSPSPQSRMLDVACGRGRHSICLASKGFEVTGIDLSFDSIAYAKQFERDNLEFFQHDMRLPFRINYYDYAFNFFTSFGYFYTRREHDDAMRTIANSLRPGGTLLFDYLNVHYVDDRLVAEEVKKIDGTTYEIKRTQDDSHFYKQITVSSESLDQPLAFIEKVAKLTLEDFKEMLALQKMEVTEVFGDYNLNAYDVKNTPRMIIIARKVRK